MNKLTEEQKKEIESLFWWHRIPLEFNEHNNPLYITPGICPHGTGADIETRFGMPKNLTGKSVLDIGTYDGLFAFEAERRGASFVHAIDIYQNSPNLEKANLPLQIAKKVLNSSVVFELNNLEGFKNSIKYDLVLYYGVMYHIEDALGAVVKLMSLTKPAGQILLETTISTNSNLPMLEYRPGFQGDYTNTWYPTKEWIELAFKTKGAKSVDIIYNDSFRATFRVNT